jgi:hypothetical protein
VKRTYLLIAGALAVLLLFVDIVSGDIDYVSWFIGLVALGVVVVLYFRGRRQVAEAEQAKAEAPEPPASE